MAMQLKRVWDGEGYSMKWVDDRYGLEMNSPWERVDTEPDSETGRASPWAAAMADPAFRQGLIEARIANPQDIGGGVPQGALQWAANQFGTDWNREDGPVDMRRMWLQSLTPEQIRADPDAMAAKREEFSQLGSLQRGMATMGLTGETAFDAFIDPYKYFPNFQGWQGTAEAGGEDFGNNKWTVPVGIALAGANDMGLLGQLFGSPPAGGEMLGEGVLGPPAPGGSFFTGPPSPGVDGFIPGPAGPTPILGEGLMGPPAPGGDFFTGPPTPAPAAPAGMPPVQNLPGTNAPILPTVPGTTTAIPPGMTAAEAATAAGAAGAAGAGGASGGTSLGNWLRSQGLDISDDALKLMGSGASTLLGLYGADKQASTLKDLADREMSIRQPFIDATKNMMADPGSYYESAPAKGATDAVLRRLAVNGNPFGNPGDISKAAVFNLGGYNDSLRTLGGLAMGSAGTTVNLGKDIAAAQGSGLNAIGSTIADLTNPKEDTLARLARLMGKSAGSGLV